MALNLMDAPTLAAALLRLRGETLAQLSRSTGIKPANLSVWLRGAPQVISERRVVMLLNALGVQGGQLRTDIVHQWRDVGDLADLCFVLSGIVTPQDAAKSVVYQEDSFSFESNVLLQVATISGDALVFVTASPSLAKRSVVTAELLGFGSTEKLDQFDFLPKSDVVQLREVIAFQMATSGGDNEEEVILSQGSGGGLFLYDAQLEPGDYVIDSAELEQAIKRALQDGVQMRQIISAIESLSIPF